jgi:hypothetical protein
MAELHALREIAAEKRAQAVNGVASTTHSLLKRTTAHIQRSEEVEQVHEASKRRVAAATGELCARLEERQQVVAAAKKVRGAAAAKMSKAIDKQAARRDQMIKQATRLWNVAAPGYINLGTARAT